MEECLSATRSSMQCFFLLPALMAYQMIMINVPFFRLNATELILQQSAVFVAPKAESSVQIFNLHVRTILFHELFMCRQRGNMTVQKQQQWNFSMQRTVN